MSYLFDQSDITKVVTYEIEELDAVINKELITVLKNTQNIMNKKEISRQMREKLDNWIL